jgi:hypothetical protein
MARSRPVNEGASRETIDRVYDQQLRREQNTPELLPETGKSNLVTVTFNITVPDGNSKLHRSVYLAGTLHQINPNLPDWDPHGQEMKKEDPHHWTITLTGPENAVVEYKYTLGNWDHVEKDAHCGEIKNRRVVFQKTPTELQIVKDTVQGWRDISPCGL